jgi:hypothetical protein
MKIGRYSASIDAYTQTLRVGCQNISFDQVLHIADQIRMIKKQTKDRRIPYKQLNRYRNLVEWNDIPFYSRSIPKEIKIIK